MNIAILAAVNSVHTLKIANSLVSLGHNVCLYTLKNHSARADLSLYNPEIKIYNLNIKGVAGYSLNKGQLNELLRQNKTDVLNVHYASGYGTLAAKCGFHPCALSVFGSDIYDFPRRSPVHERILRRNLAAADVILSTGHNMAKEAEKYLAAGKPVVVTPFGVDTALFAPGKDKFAGGQKITVGYIKGFEDVYGPEYLIRAFSRLQGLPNGRDFRLVMYGGGKTLEKCRRLAAKLCGDSVFFGGRIENSAVPSVLNTIDIFCVPSISESFGVAAVEAMACGVPCVVSNVGGLCEVVKDGVTGFCVPPRNSEAIAEKIITLSADSALRAKMGSAGRQRVLQYFDFNDNIKTIEKSLLALCAARN